MKNWRLKSRSLLSIVFFLGGLGVAAYGAYVLKEIPKQLESGKTRLTGKLLIGGVEVDKEKNKATFWLYTTWNVIRRVFGILFGLFLAGISILEILTNGVF
ncbi:MAG: hypothetical protein Q7K34_03355 [archaeon]|nr:hypothetical protein [archaeon]